MLSSSLREWQCADVWDQIVRTLRMQVRRKQGRDEEPGAATIDSHAMKTSAVRGLENGCERGKRIWGRKRHALLETQGNLQKVNIAGAEKSAQEGGYFLLSPLKETFSCRKLVWGESPSGGTFRTRARVMSRWTVQTITLLTAPKHGQLVAMREKGWSEKQFPLGLRSLHRRWVIERTFCWIGRWRRLCRAHGRLPGSSKA
jgi:putative transposase